MLDILRYKAYNKLGCRELTANISIPDSSGFVNTWRHGMDEQKLTITVEEAARLLGISRGLAYEMVRIGKIPSVRFGRRLVVPCRALEHLLDESEVASAPH